MYLEGFQWDDDKNEKNIKKHGIDFYDASTIFDRLTFEELDERKDYGETRYNSIGQMEDGTYIHLTYTERGEDIRIISARLASSKEKELFLKMERDYALELECQEKEERDRAEETERKEREEAAARAERLAQFDRMAKEAEERRKQMEQTQDQTRTLER
jgi:uncharacterized DUF497 family protein